MYYTLETWLENHEDTSLYDNVYIFDINEKEINIDEYDEDKQKIIMGAIVINHDVERDGYFTSHELILDIVKEDL